MANIERSEDDSNQQPSVGTRFLIYPQVPHLADYGVPETVWISTPPERMRAGPSDHRIHVIDPLFPKEPYEYPHLPPYQGDFHLPAEADSSGHFDQIPRGSRQFLAAHAFACTSRVLDVWESYLGHPIVWHFAETHERLEIIPNVDWDNAQSGYGYLELGFDRNGDGPPVPYALNFDVIAHEVGHAILFSVCGFPVDIRRGADFGPVHESMSDLISLLSFLHFDSGLDRLLKHCGGNLLVLNELNRIAELTGDRQIRLACNQRKLSETTADVHDRSRPFTGAVFDTMVDAYHMMLVQDGLADEGLLDVDLRGLDSDRMARISAITSRNFRERPYLFKSALTKARDRVALSLARTWQSMSGDDFDFHILSRSISETAHAMSPFLSEKFDENFTWREII